MRRVVLKAIMHLGRYAVLPVVALACAVFVAWLMAKTPETSMFKPRRDQGLAEAQLVLGEAYRLGRGVEPDQNAARRWYELAARQGNQALSKMLLEFHGCKALVAPTVRRPP
jgi:TPR repeat protein